MGCNGDIDGDPVVVVSGAVQRHRATRPGDDIAERYLLDACRHVEPRISDVRSRGEVHRGVKERPSRPFGQSFGRSIATVRLLECCVHDATVHEKGRPSMPRIASSSARSGIRSR